ncbi:unnamed protein product [Lactuca saligna]|uniref:Uncharacterized protein n=1 Tax=Lactuca saligna TaxID=75948 RepID=A0AA35YQW0_LACSI|nr:unnamed protein product [Lactuca saligna]
MLKKIFLRRSYLKILTLPFVLFLFPLPSSFYKKTFSSKHHFEFGLSSSEESKEENLDGNKLSSPPHEGTMNHIQDKEAQDTPVDDSKPCEPNSDENEDDKKTKSSTLETKSLDENIAYPFSLLETRDNISLPNSKVDSLD